MPTRGEHCIRSQDECRAKLGCIPYTSAPSACTDGSHSRTFNEEAAGDCVYQLCWTVCPRIEGVLHKRAIFYSCRTEPCWVSKRSRSADILPDFPSDTYKRTVNITCCAAHTCCCRQSNKRHN